MSVLVWFVIYLCCALVHGLRLITVPESHWPMQYCASLTLYNAFLGLLIHFLLRNSTRRSQFLALRRFNYKWVNWMGWGGENNNNNAVLLDDCTEVLRQKIRHGPRMRWRPVCAVFVRLAAGDNLLEAKLLSWILTLWPKLLFQQFSKFGVSKAAIIWQELRRHPL